MRSPPSCSFLLPALALGLVSLSAGCSKTSGGASALSTAGLPPRCSLDAGPCDPRPATATRLELGGFRGLATATGGATYVAGTLRLPTRDFDGTPLTAAGGIDVFVGRYDASTGKAKWVRRVGEAGIQEPTGLAVTDEGTVVAVGHFEGFLRADAVSLVSPTSAGADFLLGFRGSDGKLEWGQVFDDGAQGSLVSIAAAPGRDRFAVCGWASQAATGLVPGATFQGGTRDALVALFDGNGKRRWSRQIGGQGMDTCDSVTVDPAGDVYVAGRYNKSFSLSGSPLPEPGRDYNQWIWLAKLDGRSGEVLSHAVLPGAGPQYPTSLAIAPDGQLILGGMMNNSLDVGGDAGTLLGAGYTDAFVARLDPRSSPPFAARWAVRLGGPSVDGTRSVAVDPYGDVAVAGFFTVFTTGAAELQAEMPGTDAFLLMLDGSTGATRSALSYGDPDTQTAERVAFGRDDHGNPYLALGGEFTGTLRFGELQPMTGTGGATFLLFAR